VKGAATIVAAFGSASKDDWREQLKVETPFFHRPQERCSWGRFHISSNSLFFFVLASGSVIASLPPQTFAGVRNFFAHNLTASFDSADEKFQDDISNLTLQRGDPGILTIFTHGGRAYT